jgi:hypothetical protein
LSVLLNTFNNLFPVRRVATLRWPGMTWLSCVNSLRNKWLVNHKFARRNARTGLASTGLETEEAAKMPAYDTSFPFDPNGSLHTFFQSVFRQPINPDWNFGNINITYENSANPAVERWIVGKVSYGRQLGRMMEAVAALIERTGSEGFTIEPETRI